MLNKIATAVLLLMCNQALGAPPSAKCLRYDFLNWEFLSESVKCHEKIALPVLGVRLSVMEDLQYENRMHDFYFDPQLIPLVFPVSDAKFSPLKSMLSDTIVKTVLELRSLFHTNPLNIHIIVDNFRDENYFKGNPQKPLRAYQVFNGSDQTHYVYIDINHLSPGGLANSIFHELHHIYLDVAGPDKEDWIEEGLTGIFDARMGRPMNHYFDMFEVTPLPDLPSEFDYSSHKGRERYGLSYLFMKVLIEKYSDGKLLERILNNPLAGKDGILDSLATVRSWNEIVAEVYTDLFYSMDLFTLQTGVHSIGPRQALFIEIPETTKSIFVRATRPRIEFRIFNKTPKAQNWLSLHENEIKCATNQLGEYCLPAGRNVFMIVNPEDSYFEFSVE